jgi:hypothetical protein
MWQYLFLVFYLREKPESEYTAQESYIADKVPSAQSLSRAVSLTDTHCSCATLTCRSSPSTRRSR